MDPDHLGRHDSRRATRASDFVLEGSLLKPGQGGSHAPGLRNFRQATSQSGGNLQETGVKGNTYYCRLDGKIGIFGTINVPNRDSS